MMFRITQLFCESTNRARIFTITALLGLANAMGSPWLDATPKAKSAAGESADTKVFDKQVRPFLVRHCLACHGPEKAKANLRLDRLTPDFVNESSRERWQLILKRVKTGEMPPKSKPRPSEQEIGGLSAW